MPSNMWSRGLVIGARSQGSNLWQTQVIELSVPLRKHFPLDPSSYLHCQRKVTTGA